MTHLPLCNNSQMWITSYVRQDLFSEQRFSHSDHTWTVFHLCVPWTERHLLGMEIIIEIFKKIRICWSPHMSDKIPFISEWLPTIFTLERFFSCVHPKKGHLLPIYYYFKKLLSSEVSSASLSSCEKLEEWLGAAILIAQTKQSRITLNSNHK